MQVKGAVGLVTGGASSLGEAVVRMLAAEGASAAILDVAGSRGAELASEVGESAIFLTADVTDASISGIEGQVGQAAYSASKGGVIALTLPLARDLGQWGIRVMTVCPGIMDTPMLAGVDDRRRAALVDIHVFPKRLGSPGDFAHLVRSFMENTMLNGETVRLDAATRLA